MTGQQANAQDPAALADLNKWQDLLETAQSTQDADLKTAADKWSGTVTTLIGAFASITVLFAPRALTDFNSNALRDWAFWLLVLAGASGLVAIGIATTVAQGIPRIDAKMDASRFKIKTLNSRSAGVTRLRTSQAATVVAVVLVLAASAVGAVDAFRGAGAAEVDVFVVHKNGHATCAPVATAAKATAIVSITIVGHC